MNDQPVLMKNTTTGGYFVYNERTQSRMKNLIPIFEAQVTPEMEESAGLALGQYSREKEEVAPPVSAPAATTAPVVNAPVVNAPVVQVARPDTEGWSMEQLMELAEKFDIPVHPAAKEAGYNKAIDRYFVEVNAEGNQSEGIS
jgi:hypothetical protein